MGPLYHSLIVPMVAVATMQAPQPTVDLGGTVVTATRASEDPLTVPAAVDVVDHDDIRRARPRIGLAESLQRVPGVVARDRQNLAQDEQISIRGFGARSTFGVRGVRLFTDGIPATMPDGQGQVSHFPLESAERIEVLRGPYSALYGNASGGVIALTSRTAPPAAMARGALHLGSDALERLALSLHAPLVRGGLLVDAADLAVDGYRDHSRAERRSAQALLKAAYGAGAATIVVNTLDLEAKDPQGLTRDQWLADPRQASAGALAFDTRKTVAQTQAGIAVEHDLARGHSLALVAHAGERDTTQMLSIPAFVQAAPTHGGGALDLDRAYHGIDARWRWSPGGRLSLTLGGQWQVADERRRGFENFLGPTLGVVGALRRDEDNRVTGRDGYAQLDWRPAPRWRANLGVRTSRVEFRSRDRYVTASNPDDSGVVSFRETTPVAGVSFRPAEWLGLFANLGRGFETPTFSELAYRPDGASGINTALAPAVSRSVEAGVRVRRAVLAGSAVAFHVRTRDELVVVQNVGGRSVYGNAGRTARRGLELAFETRSDGPWTLATAYTWLDATNGGRQLPGTARHSAWAELAWSGPAGWSVSLEGRAVGRVVANDANDAWAPGHTRLDAAVSRALRAGGMDWDAFVRVNNLADRRYIGSVIVNDGNDRYFEPAPGRHWLVGVSAALTYGE